MTRVTSIVFTVQGDGESNTTVLTHNYNMSDEEIVNGFMIISVWSEKGQPVITWLSARQRNSVTLSHEPFAGELKVKLERP